MQSSITALLCLFLAALCHARFENSSQIIGELALCGQTCITSAFLQCNCKIGDFFCLCPCTTAIPSIRTCTGMICSASGQQEAVDSITGLCRVDPVPTPVPSTTTSTTMTSTSTPCAPTGVRNCTSAGCSINATNYTCMSWPPIVPVNPNAAGRLAGWDELVGLIAILCLSVGLTVLA